MCQSDRLVTRRLPAVLRTVSWFLIAGNLLAWLFGPLQAAALAAGVFILWRRGGRIGRTVLVYGALYLSLYWFASDWDYSNIYDFDAMQLFYVFWGHAPTVTLPLFAYAVLFASGLRAAWRWNRWQTDSGYANRAAGKRRGVARRTLTDLLWLTLWGALVAALVGRNDDLYPSIHRPALFLLVPLLAAVSGTVWRYEKSRTSFSPATELREHLKTRLLAILGIRWIQTVFSLHDESQPLPPRSGFAWLPLAFWTFLLGTQILLALPALRLEYFSAWLLLAPVPALVGALLASRYTGKSAMDRALLLVAGALQSFSLTAFRQFVITGADSARPVLAFVLVCAALPVALHLPIAGRRRAFGFAATLACAFLAFWWVPGAQGIVGRELFPGSYVSDLIWEGAENPEAIGLDYPLSQVFQFKSDDLEKIRSSPDWMDVVEPEASLAWERGSHAERPLGAGSWMVRGRSDGRPVLYDFESGVFARMEENGSVKPVCAWSPKNASAWRAGLSPDGRLLCFGIPAMHDGAKVSDGLAVLDLETDTTSTWGQYSIYDVLRWDGPAVLLLLLKRPDLVHGKAASTHCEIRTLDVRSGEDLLIRAIDRPGDLGASLRSSDALLLAASYDPTPSGQDPLHGSPEATLYEMRSQGEVPVPGFHSYPRDYDWDSVNGRLTYVVGSPGTQTIRFVDKRGLWKELDIPGNVRVHGLRLSPDKRRLALFEVQTAPVRAAGSRRIRILDLDSGESRLVAYVGVPGTFLTRDWKAEWSPDSRRFAYLAARFSPMELAWWFKYRRFPDIVEFCGQGWSVLIDGPRDCGTGLIAGPPYPYFSVRKIVDIPAN